MSAHTPGPWEVRKRGAAFSSDEIRPVQSFHGVIPLAWVAKLNDGKANAHLIAAAPDLLAALKDCLAHMSGAEKSCGHQFECVCVGRSATAAIARAEGRTP